VELTAGKLFAPTPWGNLAGLLAVTPVRLVEEIDRLVAEKKIDLLYIVGDAPFETRPPVDFIIHQGSFPPPAELNADLLLPAATWGEISGTYADIHGGRKTVNAVVEPPGMAQTNQDIFRDIAKAMGKKNLKFTPKEISKGLPENFSVKLPDIKGKGGKLKKVSPPDSFHPHLLIQERTPHAVHNVSLSSIVPGMARLIPEGTLAMNPADATRMGFKDGDPVLVESDGTKKTYPLKVQDFISPGVFFLLTRSRSHVFGTNPGPVHLSPSGS
jgi:anaerobic selenocysteine-containing dehydrogenase